MARETSIPPERAARPARRFFFAGGLVLALAAGFVLGRATAPEPAALPAQESPPKRPDRDRVVWQWSAVPQVPHVPQQTPSPEAPAPAPQPSAPVAGDREERMARDVAYASRGAAQVLGARCRKHLAPGQPAVVILEARYDPRGGFLGYEASQSEGAPSDALLECVRSSGEPLPDIEPPGREVSVKVPLTIQ